jgi:glycosyltransferase involved in cell wall biosynthesis
MTPKRIVFLTTGLLTGGAEMMLWQLTSRLDRKKFEPIVVSLRPNGPMRQKFEASGIPLVSPGMNPSSPNPLPWLRLVRILKSLGPQILQGWMYHGNVAAAWCSRFVGNPAVCFSIHNSIYDLNAEKLLTAWIIRQGGRLSSTIERVIYCAESTARQHEAIGYDTSRTLVIHNGFDTERFKPDACAKEALAAEFQINNSDTLFGLIARFDVHKDHETFVTAARLIADRLPQARFILAGRGIDTGNSNLVEIIARHRLQEHVLLLGERQDVPQIMAGLDVLVSSSSSESFPSVLGEAMACGVPCVSTDVGDSGFILGEFGRLVPPRNPQALAEGAIALASIGGDARKALSKNCREHIVHSLSISTMVGAYTNLYSELPR